MANNITAEVWSDLYQGLTIDNQGNIKKVINAEAVKTSIDNILRTYQGERIFLPQFASKLRNILFEPIGNSTIRNLANSVKESIETWDNRVSVVGVDTQIDPDNNTVSITIRFQILSYTEVFIHNVLLTQ